VRAFARVFLFASLTASGTLPSLAAPTGQAPEPGAQYVTWQNANQVTASGNSLTNTAATGWSGAGANSVEKIESGNGHVEWTAGNNSTRRFVGLSTGPLDTAHSLWDMRGHIEMGDDGWVWAGESGDPYGPGTNCGPYTDATAFKIAIEGTELKYYVGAALCRTITPTFTYPYHADVEMYTNGAPVNNVKLAGVSCTPSCWSGCGGESNGCGGTCPDTGACTNVAWTNIAGVSANGNNLSKDSGTNGDNAGANSVAALPSGNGYLEFQAGTTNKRMWVGLGKTANQSAWDLKFHFDLGTDGAIWAGEMGDPYGPGSYCGNYTTDTRFKIEVLGGKVKYYKDGTLCRTTTGATIPYPLYADNSLDTVGAVLNSVRTSGFNGGGGTYCGDAICNGTETCSTCSADCGACDSSRARGFDPATFTATFYDDFYLTDAVASEPWTRPIDFRVTCFGEPFPWEGCKLHPSLSEGNNYSVKWEGTLIIPDVGEYTFRFSEVDNEARLWIEVGGVMTEIMRVGGAAPNPGAPKTVSLIGPAVPFRVEYKQFSIGAASLTMHWQSRVLEEEIIPIHAPSNTYFEWPMGSVVGNELVLGNGIHLVQNYRSKNNPDHLDLEHTAIDLRLDAGVDETAGAPVYAAADGVVYCTNVPRADHKQNYPGGVVLIRHGLPDGTLVYSMYGHLDKTELVNESFIKVGDGVRRGDRIGSVMYQPENSHLHYEIREFAYWFHELDGNEKDADGNLGPRGAPIDHPPEESSDEISCGGPGYAPRGMALSSQPWGQKWLDPIGFYYDDHRRPYPRAVVVNDWIALRRNEDIERSAVAVYAAANYDDPPIDHLPTSSVVTGLKVEPFTDAEGSTHWFYQVEYGQGQTGYILGFYFRGYESDLRVGEPLGERGQ